MTDGWQKRGLLIGAPPPLPWARSHAALPCTDRRDDGTVDLYYSPRDADGRACVAVARISSNPERGDLSLVEHCPDPVLKPGRLGTFDESGATAVDMRSLRR